ncbi:MAG: hypothetical protein R2838_24800 [Caldilineaceae bacterium]
MTAPMTTCPWPRPLRPGGHIILSGIIQERVDIVTGRGAIQLDHLLERCRRSDWIALIARKVARRPAMLTAHDDPPLLPSRRRNRAGRRLT